MTFSELVQITGGLVLTNQKNQSVEQLVFDSRRPIVDPEHAVFFAIRGSHHDGHQFLEEIYHRGVRQFVVESDHRLPVLPGASVAKVSNSIDALQKLATARREKYQIDVIGITGSNGKTIVKEWLYQILSSHRHVVKSPSSFNSQIGVPLSVWQLNKEHQAGIFEAGISKTGEMEKLAAIIQPTAGIFTNIGSAHDEGFADRKAKIREKLKLFEKSQRLIYCRDHDDIHEQINIPGYSWGQHQDSDLRILNKKVIEGSTLITLAPDQITLNVPFTDHASLENVMHVVTCLRYLEISYEDIQEGLSRLRPLRMRLELKQARNNSYLIDDTYNNDIAGLKTALDFLSNVGRRERKSLILSDIPQTGLEEEELVKTINTIVKASGIQRFVGIGPVLHAQRALIDIEGDYYKTTAEFLTTSPESLFHNEIILIKGARRFQFEDIVKCLEDKIHGTVLEVNLSALTHNLNYFRSRLNKGVKMMVMVKAFAYGSGSLEVASLLQYHRVDYLGVAYADEGITLRRNGIRLPVMVMNPTVESFGVMKEHSLEPEIYSFSLLNELLGFLNGRSMRIHLKLDTGMHRLGFVESEIDKLAHVLQDHPELEVASIFSHLSASESDETFSRHQASSYKVMCDRLMKSMTQKPIQHLLNSSGILRYPDLQFDMIRLGIGLYGQDGHQEYGLQPVSKLRTVISQIKEIGAGETVGYGRMGRVDQTTRIATIAIGYADGFPRLLGNGAGYVSIHGQKAPVIGNVCMDMTMVDITGINANEGDEVEVFGENISLETLAGMCHTISYEILTNVSQRVKRVFYSD
jgi:alanine racemase